MVQEDVRFNPFPGLRPFEEDEDYLFFGREKQIDELLTKLRHTHFLAVVGTSGSGKSSLVKCGLLPGLYGGFMAGTSSSWRIASFRPGNDPVFHLAEALSAPGVLYDHLDPEDTDSRNMHTALLTATLTRSKRGVVDAVAEARLPKDENLLVVVDQFEELFRYKREELDQVTEERKSVAFVKLLLDAAQQREQNIFIVITMRSDFLGDCTQFRGLPEAINQGQYLIPRMTREEMKEAISGPVAVGGSEISPILLTRLLNDVGDRPDQLPVLQHALMRTWQRWEADHEEGERIELRHYEAIGTMGEALSQHADEIFEALPSEALRSDCQLVFKAITEKSEGGRGIRRPTKIRSLMKITQVSFKSIVTIAEAFRAHGCRFLMPPPDESLTEDTILDISHESLMRVWKRLQSWVDEEMVSTERYRDLAERAEKWHSFGQVGFLQDPELQLMINWRNTQQPTEAWASRFPALQYETAMVYLRVSEERRTQLEERKRRERRRKVWLLSIFALILAVFSIISIGLYFQAHKAHLDALQANMELDSTNNKLDATLKTVQEERDRAEMLKKFADMSAEEAKQERLRAEAREADAQAARLDALGQRQAALDAKRRADSLRGRAETSELLAKQNEERALDAEDRAVSALSETDRLKKLAEARGGGISAYRKLSENRMEEGMELALQAYDTNRHYAGPTENEDIYPALNFAWKSKQSREAYEFVMSRYDVRALTYSPQSGYLASGDNGGHVQLHTTGNALTQRSQLLLADPVRALAWSPTGDTLAVGMRNGMVVTVATNRLEAKPSLDWIRQTPTPTTRQSPVRALATLQHQGATYLLVALGTEIRVSSLKNPNQALKTWTSPTGTVQALTVAQGRLYVGAGATVFQLALKGTGASLALEQVGSLTVEEANLSISALAVHQEQLAIGGTTGTLWILPVSRVMPGTSPPSSFPRQRYRYHQAEITRLEFHPQGIQLLSTSLDQTARLWPEGLWKAPVEGPVSDVLVLTEHQAWVWGGTYLADGDYLATGGQDKKVIRWFASSALLAEEVRKLMK